MLQREGVCQGRDVIAAVTLGFVFAGVRRHETRLPEIVEMWLKHVEAGIRLGAGG